MKILYFIDHLRPDGTQRVLGQLVRGLAERGHAQMVVCLNDSVDGTLVKALQESGAVVEIVGKRALLLGYGLGRIWKNLVREHFDAVVTLLFASDIVGRTLAHFAHVPRIITSIRARNVNYSPWMLHLDRMTMRWADAVILNSRAVADFAIQKEGVAPNKIHIIPNGIDVCSFEHSARSNLAEFGILPNKPVIGSVGRLESQKGYDVLIDALGDLSDVSPYLFVMGEGKERQQLLDRARRRNVRLVLAGYRRDVPKLFSGLDVYVQPSRFEGMPNALLEAMAVGLPVVATDVDGSRELIPNDEYGWLVPTENPARLGTALREAISNKALARARGCAARQRAVREYSIAAMVNRWEQVLHG